MHSNSVNSARRTAPTQHAGLMQVSTSQRVRALTFDLALGAAIGAGAGMLAAAWLLAATGLGAREPDALVNSVGFAIFLAAVPAWYGYNAASTWAGEPARGNTHGQRRAGIAVSGTPRRRLLRLAVHPISALGWWWAAGMSALATIPVLAPLLAAIGLIVLGGGLVSAAILVIRPAAPALHDRVAGTEVVSV